MNIRLDNFKFTARPANLLGTGRSKFLRAQYNTTLTNTIPHNTFTNVSLRLVESNGIILRPPGITGQFQVEQGGLYSFQAGIMFNSFAPTNDVGMLQINVNGSNTRRIDRKIFNGVSQFPYLNGSCSIYLNKGDYFELLLFQNSGSNKSVYNQGPTSTNGLYTYMDVVRIGE